MRSSRATANGNSDAAGTCVLLHLLVNQVFVLEDEINLSRRCRSLQLLTVQHLFLQILDGL